MRSTHAFFALAGLFLAGSAPSAAGLRDLEATCFSLGQAISEVDACCAGRVAEAPVATQRRWSYPLLRLVILG